MAIIKSWIAQKLQVANLSPLVFAYTLAELSCAENVGRLQEADSLE